MNPHGVQLQGLTVTAGSEVLVRNLSLEFDPGRCHVILGPSGSGKTTLLRCINRLNDLFDGLEVRGGITVPWDEGQARAHDPGLDVEQLRRRVAMVFQNPNILPVSVERNFGIPLEAVLGLQTAAVAGRMRGALEAVGLWDEVVDRLDHPADQLSGGQQQRLCLARALALEARVLLLDEPTANLDFRATAAIETLLGRLKRDRVLVVVSHSLAQAARVADRIVVLRDGQVVLDRPRDSWPDAEQLTREITGLFPLDT